MGTKIYLYELRRALLSKTTLFLMVLAAAYAAYLFKTQVLFGVAGTAPFSQWSFLQYLFQLLPLLATIILLFVSKLYAPAEKNTRKIIAATPFSPSLYFYIRLAVFVTLYLLAAGVTIGICFLFYGAVLGYTAFHTLAFCILLALLPQLFLILGLGLFLGQINHNLPLALIATLFIVSAVGIAPPYYADFMGYSIMSIPARAIPTNGHIPFDVPAEYLGSRIVFCLIGIALIAISGRSYSSLKKSRK